MMRRWQFAAATVAALITTGCAFSPALRQVAVDHNRMVADAEDELALLNIVRAAHRFPLHFTAITEVGGDAKLSVAGGLDIGLEPGPDPTGATLEGGVSSSPSFKASVLATDKFQRGIQAPIGSELVAYYLDEGWRDELLMALFIERVEPVDPTAGPDTAIVNNPSADGAFARLLCTHELVSRPTSASRPLARFEDLIDLGLLAGKDSTAAARRQEIDSFLGLRSKDGIQFTEGVLSLEGSSNSVQLVPRAQSRCDGVAAVIGGAPLRPRFRSTMGVIYFLGEYQRVAEELGSDTVYQLPSCFGACVPGSFVSRPLIAIDRGAGESLVDTRFRGNRYFISAEEDRNLRADRGDKPRTLQVIALIQQLVNLQKSADTLPRSLSITGLN